MRDGVAAPLSLPSRQVGFPQHPPNFSGVEVPEAAKPVHVVTLSFMVIPQSVSVICSIRNPVCPSDCFECWGNSFRWWLRSDYPTHPSSINRIRITVQGDTKFFFRTFWYDFSEIGLEIFCPLKSDKDFGSISEVCAPSGTHSRLKNWKKTKNFWDRTTMIRRSNYVRSQIFRENLAGDVWLQKNKENRAKKWIGNP